MREVYRASAAAYLQSSDVERMASNGRESDPVCRDRPPCCSRASQRGSCFSFSFFPLPTP